jgi:hypothetical protein
MAAVVSASDIPPGGEGKIEVKINTQKRTGSLKKSVTVYSNDPKNPQYVLSIQGLVEVIAGFEPKRIDFGQVEKGATVTKTAKIIAKEPEKLKITELKVDPSDDIKAELIEEKGQASVKLTLTAPKEARRIGARLIAKTNLKSPEEIMLSINAKISEDLVADKGYVFFSASNQGPASGPYSHAFSLLMAPLADKRSISKLKVSSLSKKPFKITNIEDTDNAVIGTAEQYDDDWHVSLMLTDPSASSKGTIKIHTDRNEQPTLEIRYSSRTTRAYQKPGKTIQPARSSKYRNANEPGFKKIDSIMRPKQTKHMKAANKDKPRPKAQLTPRTGKIPQKKFKPQLLNKKQGAPVKDK